MLTRIRLTTALLAFVGLGPTPRANALDISNRSNEVILAHFSHSLRETFPTRASEWALGVMMFNWSLILIFNPTLFADLPNYTALKAVMPQSAWAMLCFFGGGGRLIMLTVNGAWRRSPHLRAVAAFLACFFWFQVSMALFTTGLYATGLAIYPVLLLLDIYNVIRAAGDAGSSDHIHIGDRNASHA